MVASGLPHRRKPEDTAQGCRDLAHADRTRAADATSDHMRGTLERSARAWGDRADLLDRLEANSSARAEAVAAARKALHSEREDDGQGTGSVEQRKAQAQGERRQEGQGARFRIKGLSPAPERKDDDAD